MAAIFITSQFYSLVINASIKLVVSKNVSTVGKSNVIGSVSVLCLLFKPFLFWEGCFFLHSVKYCPQNTFMFDFPNSGISQ